MPAQESRPERAGSQPPLSDGSVLIARDHPELLMRVPAMIYIAEDGPRGAWRYVSPQIEAILGYTAAEWCADPNLWYERLHPQDRERVLTHEVQITPGTRDVEEYRLTHRDGRVIWIRDDAELVVEDGHRYWHGVLTDITEHKEFELELERRAAQQAAVAGLGERALEGKSPAELLEQVVEMASELLDVDLAAMLEYLPEENAFSRRAQYGVDTEIDPTLVPATEDTAHGVTMINRAPVVIEDWATQTRFLQQPHLAALGMRSGALVPIEGAHGTFGVLAVAARAPRVYRADEIDFLQSLANVLADALERKAIEDEIRHSALHDDLTGLPNRTLFLDRIEQALARLRRRKSMAAILFLDFDHFKVINDSLGHHVGDELLAAAAPRIKHAVRASDTVARFGGDEFAILLEEIAGEADAIEMAERVAALFTRPFVIAGSEHFVSASVGIAIAHGGELPMELVRDADAAMYRAKERGRSRYEVFDEAMRGRALARLRVENDLRRALERGELRLDYQPVVSLRDRSMTGVEALIRWHHPQRGLIPPAEFIPVAEENGLIEPIGRWVLDRACRQAAHWHAIAPDSRPLEIAVNLSAVQLTKTGLTDTVGAALQASGLDPACLCLEITETAMLREPDAIEDTLRALGELGVRVVLDDFGTGYSSLSYLPRLPLDALKIDRSFVDGLGIEPRDTAITEAIVAMSRALTLGVVAEGVEHERQVAELVRLGCEFAQGFHFSRPVPAGDISAMLHDGPRWPVAAPPPAS